MNIEGSVQQSITANDDCSSLTSEWVNNTNTQWVKSGSRSKFKKWKESPYKWEKNRKQEKLKRKLPHDSQLPSIAQNEMKVKKQLLDKLDSMDQQYSDTMKSLPSFWKRCVFGVHTDTDAVAFSKRSTFNSVFKRIRFRWKRLAWTGGQNTYISTRFKTKTHQCGRGLSILANFDKR